MKISKSYIFQSFAILIMASGFFLFFKTYLPKKIFSESTVDNQHIVVDSLMLEALQQQDSLKNSTANAKENDSLSQSKEVVSTEPANTFKGMVYLDPFFEKIYQLEQQHTGKVRIAYFGDSMTDGDLIVQDLRRNYQMNYGGSGVGFVPITSESAKSRGSIVHRYSTNWKTQSYLNVKRPLKPFGVSGQVFFANDTVRPTWISFQAGQTSNVAQLNQPVLYYGASNNTRGTVSWISGSDTVVRRLTPNKALNALRISDRNMSSLKVEFDHADSIPIYGFDFTAAQAGVQVDNFSSRGNSGLPLSLFQPGLMNRFQEHLQYDLIVLHFGTNVLNYSSYNYNWYTKQMSRVVTHLRACFPNAAILVISTADKSTKYDLLMQTDSAVVPLVQAQRKYAMEERTGFMNLYEAMGGKNAMVSWVENSPAKANKDYTHFNFRGAQEVAKMIYSQLEDGFADYKQRRSVSGGFVKPMISPAVISTGIAPEREVKKEETKATVAGARKEEVVKSTPSVVLPATTSSDVVIRHLVREGETFTSIAAKYEITVEELKKANGIHSDVVQKDWKLTIPISNKKLLELQEKQKKRKELIAPKAKVETTSSKEGHTTYHVVKVGETLTSIARQYHVTIEDLKRVNNLTTDVAQKDKKLIIPVKAGTKPSKEVVPETAAKKKASKPTTMISYRVKEGDNLTLLARKYGVSVATLKELNKLESDTIEIEQLLVIPSKEKEQKNEKKRNEN